MSSSSSNVPAVSTARAGFRSAKEEIDAYSPARGQFPAFMTSVAHLPPIARAPLTEQAATTAYAPPWLTATRALDRMVEGALSAVEVVEQAYDAIQARESALNAFVYIAPEAELMAQARQLDMERRAGRVRGPLHGLTLAVKDLIAVRGMPNTASSEVLAGEVADADAGSVRLLREAGAIIVGKTHTHEFALGVVTPQSRNPWDETRDPGGSSGGSAIALVAGMSLLALGTDTRASSRVPTALCGAVGFKPTFGIVPGDGVITLSWSLDHIAPMTTTVEDAALMLNVLTRETTGEDYRPWVRKSVAGMRIGVPVAACDGVDAEVLAAHERSVQALRDLGVIVEEIDQPDAHDFHLSMLMGLVVSRCEAATYHLAFAGRESLYTTVVAEQMDEAAQVSAVDYLKAQRWREEFRTRMHGLLTHYDGLLMPTTAIAAPKSTEVDEYFLILSRNCIPWSFIGFPACSVPAGYTAAGLPVGAQLVTGPREDGRLLALAAALERAMGDGRQA